MAIQLTIVLRGTGGDLERVELAFEQRDQVIGIQQRIREVLANWSYCPGDTIEILGNEEAFDNL